MAHRVPGGAEEGLEGPRMSFSESLPTILVLGEFTPLACCRLGRPRQARQLDVPLADPLAVPRVPGRMSDAP